MLISSGGVAEDQTAAGVVIDHGERELHTRSVGAIGFVWEERRTLTTVISGEHAQGLKPFGFAQECGNRDTQNPEFVRTVHWKGCLESDQPFADS
jgi:hypothetical protein